MVILKMRFSQRIGISTVRSSLQIESVDERLKNRLWNVFLDNFIGGLPNYTTHGDSKQGNILKYIWKEFFAFRLDKIPQYGSGRVHESGVINHITDWYFSKAQWFDIYDFVEFIAQIDLTLNIGFAKKCNDVLKIEVAGYRIIN